VGVTTENINAYTLASVKELLTRVPALDGLQFRVHEESGLATEGMEGFWHAIFENVQKARPGMLIELRGKNTPDAVINAALSLGVDLRIETKYWMEQMGMPFHPMHVNPQDQRNRRRGYADFLRYPQRYRMTWRLWNGGTTRILRWGDPEHVRRYGASTALYDSPNWDVQEPLATKMEAQRPDKPTFDLMPANAGLLALGLFGWSIWLHRQGALLPRNLPVTNVSVGELVKWDSLCHTDRDALQD
jgi:hypothetical protein